MTRHEILAAVREGRSLRDADLRGAKLEGVDLEGVDLRAADLGYANLRDANLRGADLEGADLEDANLEGANLRAADLRYADLLGANLRGANLRGVDLQYANLRGAYLRGAKWDARTRWPAVPMMLSANWGRVSDALTVELMRYDAACHPDPTAFDRWAARMNKAARLKRRLMAMLFADPAIPEPIGPCPYDDTTPPRAAHFKERRDLWSPGPCPRPYDLFVRLLAECCVEEGNDG